MPSALQRRVAELLPGTAATKVARARNLVAGAALRWQRKVSTPGAFSLSLRDALNMLYPEALPADLGLDEVARRAARSLRVRDLQAIRRILAALDGPSAPSPFQVRFGPRDVVRVEIGSIRLVLDVADVSVSQDIIQGRGYEPEVTRVLEERLRPGMTFVDIGANVGYHALVGSQLVGPVGRVFAVEPFSENCRLILMSVAENGVENLTLLPVALHDHQGWSHLSTHIGSNASLISDEIGEIARGYGVIVPAFRLDDLITGPIHLVKIDVEGAEARAVAGARQLIAKWRPAVVSEVSEEMLARVSGSSVREYLGWFVSQGYSVSVLDRTGGEPKVVDDLDHFLSTWGDPSRIENLLLLPDPGDGLAA